MLFMGDSLVEYFDWQKRFPQHIVTNLGMAGESVQGLFSRVLTVRDVCDSPDLIFLMSGINNLAMGDTAFINFYRVALEKLKASFPATRLYVCSLLPVNADFIKDEDVLLVNRDLKALALELEAVYLDIYSSFHHDDGKINLDCLLEDGVHISETGYHIWSGELQKII